jgi:hypothetical protein
VQQRGQEGIEAHQSPTMFSGSSGGAATLGSCSLAVSFARVWGGVMSAEQRGIIEGFRIIVNQKNSYGCEQASQVLI